MNSKTLRIVLAAVLAALVAVFTMFFKIPTGIGYANLGDGVILFGGLLLGPTAAVSAAVGSALADFLLGYPVYIIPTFIIKGMMGWICGRLLSKDKSVMRQGAVYVVCELWMTLGYFLAEAFVLSYGVPGAAGSIVANLMQGAVGVILALALSPARRGIERALNLE